MPRNEGPGTRWTPGRQGAVLLQPPPPPPAPAFPSGKRRGALCGGAGNGRFVDPTPIADVQLTATDCDCLTGCKWGCSMKEGGNRVAQPYLLSPLSPSAVPAPVLSQRIGGFQCPGRSCDGSVLHSLRGALRSGRPITFEGMPPASDPRETTCGW